MEAMVLSIREMQKTVEKCKIGSFDEAFKQYTSIKRDQHGNQQHYEEQHAAMKFKIQQHGNQQRTDSSKVHWQVQKVKERLVRGGHKDGVAKFLAAAVMNFHVASQVEGFVPEQAYDSKKIQVNVLDGFDFESPDVFTWLKDKQEAFGKWKCTLEEFIEFKVRSCQEAADANARWIGSYGCISECILNANSCGLFKDRG